MSSANQPTVVPRVGGRSRPVPAGWLPAPPPNLALAEPWSAELVEPGSPGLDVVHGWMHQPHVVRFWGQNWSAADWAEEVRSQLAGDHSRPWLVRRDGEPFAYLEVYRVALDVVADAWPDPTDDRLRHDLGVHIAIGDAGNAGHGLGPALLSAVVEGLLAAEPACERIVADPDAAHGVARRAFAKAGFAVVAEVDLPHKRALLMAAGRTCS